MQAGSSPSEPQGSRCSPRPHLIPACGPPAGGGFPLLCDHMADLLFVQPHDARWCHFSQRKARLSGVHGPKAQTAARRFNPGACRRLRPEPTGPEAARTVPLQALCPGRPPRPPTCPRPSPGWGSSSSRPPTTAGPARERAPDWGWAPGASHATPSCCVLLLRGQGQWGGLKRWFCQDTDAPSCFLLSPKRGSSISLWYNAQARNLVLFSGWGALWREETLLWAFTVDGQGWGTGQSVLLPCQPLPSPGRTRHTSWTDSKALSRETRWGGV